MLAWRLTQGDITTKLDGSYVFDPADDGGTEITYHLEVELRVPIPGFIKMRAQSRIMSTALRELKARAESPTRDRRPRPAGGDGVPGGHASVWTSVGPRSWAWPWTADGAVVAEARVTHPHGCRARGTRGRAASRWPTPWPRW